METFLTADDPSHLPGMSIDPFGFERSYIFLAYKILPGLTNVASPPRYFALLCAGIQLSGDRILIRSASRSAIGREPFYVWNDPGPSPMCLRDRIKVAASAALSMIFAGPQKSFIMPHLSGSLNFPEFQTAGNRTAKNVCKLNLPALG